MQGVGISQRGEGVPTEMLSNAGKCRRFSVQLSLYSICKWCQTNLKIYTRCHWIRWLIHASLRKRRHEKYTNAYVGAPLGKCYENLLLNVILSLWKTCILENNNYSYYYDFLIFQDGRSRTCHCHSEKLKHIQHKRYGKYNQIAWMNFSACHIPQN